MRREELQFSGKIINYYMVKGMVSSESVVDCRGWLRFLVASALLVNNGGQHQQNLSRNRLCASGGEITFLSHGLMCTATTSYGHTYSKSMDEPGKVANLARGQPNGENEYFPVRVRALEVGLAIRVRQSRPAPACSSPY